MLAQVAPLDTTSGRYYQPIFANVQVTVTSPTARPRPTPGLPAAAARRVPARRRHRDAPAGAHLRIRAAFIRLEN
ncbi:MAG: hypothetical protein WKG07_38420 [Hymenobacter sp.]